MSVKTQVKLRQMLRELKKKGDKYSPINPIFLNKQIKYDVKKSKGKKRKTLKKTKTIRKKRTLNKRKTFNKRKTYRKKK